MSTRSVLVRWKDGIPAVITLTSQTEQGHHSSQTVYTSILDKRLSSFNRYGPAKSAHSCGETYVCGTAEQRPRGNRKIPMSDRSPHMTGRVGWRHDRVHFACLRMSDWGVCNGMTQVAATKAAEKAAGLKKAASTAKSEEMHLFSRIPSEDSVAGRIKNWGDKIKKLQARYLSSGLPRAGVV